MGIEDIEPVFRQRGQIPIEGSGIRHDLAAFLLKGDKNPRLGALLGCVDQYLQREDGFARSRTAHRQGRAILWQPAAAQFIKAFDAGGSLGERLRIRSFRLVHGNSLISENPLTVSLALCAR